MVDWQKISDDISTMEKQIQDAINSRNKTSVDAYCHQLRDYMTVVISIVEEE